MPYHYLEIIRGMDVGKRYLLSDGSLTVGRDPDSAICINPDERLVSGLHAVIYKFPDSVTIQDMSSRNGVYVNDEKVTQQELAAEDIIGFGEKGPRFKLIISQKELPLEPGSSEDKPPQRESLGTSAESTGFEIRSSKKGSVLPGENLSSDCTSSTMEYEKKILSKRISAREMQKLLNKSDKVEKILEEGNLSQTQVHFLHTAYNAHRKSRKQFIVILGIVIFISAVISAFFVTKMLHYKSQVNRAVNLEEELNGYEKKIEKAKSRGEDLDQIDSLVKELEERKNEFNSVSMVLKEEDLQKIYQDTIEVLLSDILSRFGESEYHLPPKMVERVKYHIEQFSGPLRYTATRFFEGKNRYFPMIERIFTDKRVPLELAYISMLESGFNPKAESHAGAVGLWQFMPATGKRFGLKISKITDERADPEKATFAAAAYLKELISIFGSKSSIMLAIAAYNAGEGRIIGALRKIDDPMRNRDFWYIYRLGILAEETNEYIPKILALMILDQNREHFGF
ncbi:MAG: transglycosylase SLT domain-containing protein [Chitinispirillaceae bacterium]